MGTWVWLTVIGVVAVVLFALAWRSSGRAPIRRGGPETSMTPEQRERIADAQVEHGGGLRGPAL
ncbi:MAG: hypothetical protein JF565_05760 [Propionibacteriales bacterium]|nr:hypothetical protein [Propionibacteriales bacterium]